MRVMNKMKLTTDKIIKFFRESLINHSYLILDFYIRLIFMEQRYAPIV